jgi:hypothetical protein
MYLSQIHPILAVFYPQPGRQDDCLTVKVQEYFYYFVFYVNQLVGGWANTYPFENDPETYSSS